MTIVKKAALALMIGLVITNLTAFKGSYRRSSSCALIQASFCTESDTTWEYRGVPEYLSRIRDNSMDPNRVLDTKYRVEVGKYVRGVALWSAAVAILMGLSELEKRPKLRIKKAKQ